MVHSVKLPTKQANLDELKNDLDDLNLSIGNVKQALLQSAIISEEMALKGYRRLRAIINKDKKEWKKHFNQDALLVKWFGKASKKGHVKDVHNRMKSAYRRIDKGLKIRLRPQKDLPSNARNHGTFFDPKAFRVFPKIFSSGIDTTYIASVFVHEMLHLWFKDQKLDGATVYDEATAIDLAKREPKKARKSAENYERFVKELYGMA